MTSVSRKLRRTQTVPEQILWSRLRARRTADLKFRRQVPVGRFVLDFYCESARLAVELDGESHVGTGCVDDTRSRLLNQQHGITVIRVTNDDVLQHLDEVVEHIAVCALQLQTALTPNPSPRGRGE